MKKCGHLSGSDAGVVQTNNYEIIDPEVKFNWRQALNYKHAPDFKARGTSDALIFSKDFSIWASERVSLHFKTCMRLGTTF